MRGARVAVIGAGPIGLEAALAAREQGYDVTVYEAGRVGEALRRFEDVTLFTPFAMNATDRGRSRLRARGVSLPGEDALLTAAELAARYLDPLARLPDLEGRVREGTRVTHLAREGVAKTQIGGAGPGGLGRAGRPFLLRLDRAGRTEIERADVVLDASGILTQPLATGLGGLPAAGEEEAGLPIDRHLPPLLGSARERYAGARVLLIGAGHSAATALVWLEALAKEGTPAQVAWVVRDRGAGPPFHAIPDDPLPERRALAARANEIAAAAPWLTRLADYHVLGYEEAAGGGSGTARGAGVRVRLVGPGGTARALDVDRVLALVGYRPDATLARELPIHLCYASEAPMALASALLAASGSPGSPGSNDCLAQRSHGPETLRTTEPGYFVIGSKAYGRAKNFLLRVGHEQIDDVLTLLEAESGAPHPEVAR